MRNKGKIFLLLLIVSIFLSISVVSAHENISISNTSDTNIINNDISSDLSDSSDMNDKKYELNDDLIKDGENKQKLSYFSSSKTKVNLTVDQVIATEGEPININANLSKEGLNGNMSFRIVSVYGEGFDKTYNTIIENSSLSFVLDEYLPVGEYIYSASCNGTSYNKYFECYADSTLDVIGTAKITASNYSSYYKSGAKYTIKVINSYTKKAIPKQNIKITFYKSSNVYKTIKAVTDSNGQYKGKVNFGIGKYTMKVATSDKNYTSNIATAKVTVNKAKVKMKAYKEDWWYGYYSTVSAKLSDSKGNDITEGKVKFKINGKTYTVKVDKDGYAYKDLKLPKAKTYKYTATFSGNNYETKTVSSTVKVKPTYKTKIIVSSVTGYSNKKKTITVTVKQSNGKKLSYDTPYYGTISVTYNGKTNYYDVNKKGQAKFTIKLGNNLRGYTALGMNQYYYKKVVKNCKIQYNAFTPKYRDSSKTIKVTSKYKCAACGKTKSHRHGPFVYIYAY